MGNDIPTVEEVLIKHQVNGEDMILSDTIKKVKEAMIEFAKLHVEAALKVAANTRLNSFYDSSEEQEKIIFSYPLENIK